MDYYDPQDNYLDGEAFRNYTVTVYEAITGRVSVGDIRRVLGNAYKPEWTQDAISALEGVGKIRKVWGVPSRFERNHRVMDGKGVLPGPAKPADRSKAIFPESSRKVTA
jgi:hypothetical protein